VGGQEVGADEEEYQVGCLDVLVNLVSPRAARQYSSLMPPFDDAHAPEQREVFLQLVSERLVLVRVGVEDVDGFDGGRRLRLWQGQVLAGERLPERAEALLEVRAEVRDRGAAGEVSRRARPDPNGDEPVAQVRRLGARAPTRFQRVKVIGGVRGGDESHPPAQAERAFERQEVGHPRAVRETLCEKDQLLPAPVVLTRQPLGELRGEIRVGAVVEEQEVVLEARAERVCVAYGGADFDLAVADLDELRLVRVEAQLAEPPPRALAPGDFEEQAVRVRDFDLVCGRRGRVAELDEHRQLGGARGAGRAQKRRRAARGFLLEKAHAELNSPERLWRELPQPPFGHGAARQRLK